MHKKDLSESKLTERQLTKRENQFNLMFENAPLSYQSLDVNTRLIDVNPAWLKTMGYNRDEVIGHYFSENSFAYIQKPIELVEVSTKKQ